MPIKVTTEDFRQKAQKIHGDTYDYSLVEYNFNRIKVKIICKEHGVFQQTPEQHLSGKGCIKCGYKKSSEKRLGTENDFLTKAMNVHNNIYDYSLVDYENSTTEIKIICKEHGVFEQRPASHLQGHGCPNCAKNLKSLKATYTKEQFIEKAKNIHKNTYNYSKAEYKNAHTKIKICCKIHGVFEQKPYAHLQGQGCAKCVDSGRGWTYTLWQKAGERSKNFDSFKVYIIRCWNDEEEFYKIGKTFTTLKYRFRTNEKMPYNYEVVKIYEGTAQDMSKLEKKLQTKNKDNKHFSKINFQGMSECFKINIELYGKL